MAAHTTMVAILQLSPWPEIALAVVEILVGYGVTAWILRGRLRDDLQTIRRLFSTITPANTPADTSVVLNK